GKPSPPGRGGGVRGIMRTPGSFDRAAAASIWSRAVDFFLWLHGLVTIPPNPPPGEVIWKVMSLSGNEPNTSPTLVANSFVGSSVALAADRMIANTTPCSA